MAKRTIESKGYDNGYNDAIEKIKQMLAGGQQGGQGGQSMTPDPKLQQPDPKDNPNDNQSGQSGSGSEGGQDQQSGSGSSGGSNNQSGSNSQSGSGEKSNRDADSTGKKGIVRAEDCEPIGDISDMGNEPGGMVDQKTADKVAKQEGYDPAGGSEASTEKEWSELLKTKNCKGQFVVKDGVKGYLVTSKKTGYEDKSIFLPSAGCFVGTKASSIGRDGFYWSSTGLETNTDYAWSIYAVPSHVYKLDALRFLRQSVRLVAE